MKPILDLAILDTSFPNYKPSETVKNNYKNYLKKTNKIKKLNETKQIKKSTFIPTSNTIAENDNSFKIYSHNQLNKLTDEPLKRFIPHMMTDFLNYVKFPNCNKCFNMKDNKSSIIDASILSAHKNNTNLSEAKNYLKKLGHKKITKKQHECLYDLTKKAMLIKSPLPEITLNNLDTIAKNYMYINNI